MNTELAESCIRIMTFVDSQKSPISYKALQSAIFRFVKPPYDLRYCIDHLKELGQIIEVKWTHGFPLQVETLLGTPQVMETFENAAGKPAPPRTPLTELKNYIETNLTNPHRAAVLELITKLDNTLKS